MLEVDKIQSMSELERKMTEKQFRKPLKDFLKEHFKNRIVSREKEARMKAMAQSALAKKDMQIGEKDKLTYGRHMGRDAWYIRTQGGRVKSWGVDKQMAPDYEGHKRDMQLRIQIKQREIERLENRIKQVEARQEKEQKKQDEQAKKE